MTPRVQCRPLAEHETAAVAALAQRVFDEFVAPLYSLEGRQEFARQALADAFRDRHGRDHLTFAPVGAEQTVGGIRFVPMEYEFKPAPGSGSPP